MNDVFDRLTVLSGALIFTEGESATVAYLIRSGSVEIFVTHDESDVLLAIRGPGEIIGEMAIIDAGKRSASVRAREDCDLVIVTCDQIMHRIENADPIIRMYLRTIIERLRETSANVAKYDVATPTSNAVSNHHDFQKAIGTLSVESELRRALKSNELELFFQPIVRFDDGRLAGFEALIRWNHPERGLISPGEFIPVAEACGLIAEITSWCLAEIGGLFPKIQEAALFNMQAVAAPLFMNVNVSGFDLGRPSFLDALLTMLNTTGIPADTIKLEVTEGVLLTDPDRAAASLVACHDLGVQIAIDDFGTGFSSLSYLSALPISTIKIDRSFIKTMMQDPKQMKIVQMILRLAEELGFSVVAEGIEQDIQADALRSSGCAYGQGYMFGKPTAIAQTLHLTRHWRARTGATFGKKKNISLA